MATSAKRKRVALDIQTKVKILKQLDEGSSVKHLCETYNIGSSTIYDLKNKKKEILEFYSKAENPSLMNKRKTMHQAKNEDVDKVLMEWIRQRRLSKFPLTRDIIMTQARKFHQDLKLSQNCDYSTGWFYRFKKRNGLRLINLHGEKASADTEAAEDYVENMVDDIVKGYTLDQIFNADETGLQFKYLPKKTYATSTEKDIGGSKEAKQRLTLLACSNAAGSCKIKLAVIGKSKNPRALKGIKVLPVYYRANKKAWITQELFIEWFKTQFLPQARAHCRSVGLPPDCKLLLFLDNCTAHPPAELLSAENVRIEYIPANTTSLIQPLDQGVLRSLKCNYKGQFLRRLLDDIDKFSLEECQKNFNVKDALWMAAKAWENVSKETLANSWRNLIPATVFLQEDDSDVNFQGFKISEEKLIMQELLDYSSKCANFMLQEADIAECFDVDKEIQVVNDVSDAEIIDMVLNNANESSEDEIDEIPECKISNDECLELTRNLILGLEQKSFVDDSHIMALHKIQELLLKQKRNFRQLKVNDMFQNSS